LVFKLRVGIPVTLVEAVNDAVSKVKIFRALSGVRIFVTGNYFPVLRDVLTSIAGDSQRVMLGNQSITRLTNLLKC
ncbi:hypothetical protein ANCCAN_08920, partial [Ancylostoma caninum]